MHTTDTMTQIDAVVPARAFDRPVPRRENDRLSVIGDNHLSLGLRARLLLDEHQLSAFPIAPLLAKQKYHLQWKADLAIEILMQTVETSGLVVQHQRRRLGLPCFVTSLQKCLMVARVLTSRLTQRARPVISNFRQVRISGAS